MPPPIRPARAPAGASAGDGVRPNGQPAPFVLYVEGPRDRDVLRIWCQRHQQQSVESVRTAVILGGRQPHRALEHFHNLRATEPAARGLCVLDRDHGAGPEPDPGDAALEFFTWGRRHIESYVLVPAALRRLARDQKERFRIERFARDHLPREGDDEAWRRLDAKRLIERDGPLARGLGRPLPVAEIARALRSDELHEAVRALLDRLHPAQ
jgi:hypothetical protein